MTLAKICGLSTAPAVDAALSGGASHLGFIFFPTSPRNIDPEAAARLAAPARGRASIVAVTVDPDDALLERLARELAPDFIQLHGRETPSRVAEIGRRFSCGLIKVLPTAEAGDVKAARDYEAVADHLMF